MEVNAQHHGLVTNILQNILFCLPQLILSSTEERKSYRFGTIPVNDDRIFIFGCTNPLIGSWC